MSFKIAFIGAGSIGFTRGLLSDLLSVPEFHDVEVAFTDISAANLSMVTRLCQRDIDENGLSIRIQSTLDRREAFRGAKYIVNCMRVGMLEAFKLDVEIPLKYGVDQCVGDTLSAGGVMYGQRDIAVLKDMCRDIREVALPDCLLLNYANPNAMVTWYCNQYGGVNTIGLCHGVQGGHELIARALGLKRDEVEIICAGINHMTWYISVKHNGVDVNDRLLPALMAHPEYSRTEKVRIDMMKRFGYFSTESNGHLSEYVPWYRKRTGEINRWIDLGVWINGETGGYLRVCTEGRNWFETDFPNWMKEPARKYDYAKRSREHGSYIIEGLETGRVYRGHFNVVNRGAISNLPDDCVVEVPGYVDYNGVSIPRVGDLPAGCAACCLSNVTVQRLAVMAGVSGDDQLLRQAMMMDPLVGAVCNPDEIWQMVDEMLIAQAAWLPQYADAIERAKARWQKAEAEGTLIPPIITEGAARLHTKTVEEMAANRAAASRNAAEADKAQERPMARPAAK
ncbi:MAG: alpha-glucosidase/alpha-galactosidase [Clostridiales bacterium]|nr:alpha-glucosidase/alpha-galactosidase [Clostridiales bacterium]